MRLGDVAVSLVPVGGGELLEQPNGQVLARPGQVYRIRIENLDRAHRAVATVSIDGAPMTEGGLVLSAAGEPRSVVELERPMMDGEHGRFTVVPEGDERVFGEGGGRDNPDLGLVEVAYRRELRQVVQRERSYLAMSREPSREKLEAAMRHLFPGESLAEGASSPPPHEPAAPEAGATPDAPPRIAHGADAVDPPPALAAPVSPSLVEGAAGTGLTGRSEQRFRVVRVGPLEPEPTIVRLRLVLAHEAAFPPRPLPRPVVRESALPPRPAARP